MAAAGGATSFPTKKIHLAGELRTALFALSAVCLSYVYAAIVNALEQRYATLDRSVAYSVVFLMPIALALAMTASLSRALSGRAGFILAIALSGWAVTFFIMLASKLDEPFFQWQTTSKIPTPSRAMVWLATATPALTAIASLLLARLRAAQWLGRIARRVAWVALALNTALVVFAIVRSVNHAEAESYLPRLMIVGSASPNTAIDFDGITVSYEAPPVPELPILRQVDSRYTECPLTHAGVMLVRDGLCDGVDVLYDSASNVHYLHFHGLAKPSIAFPHASPPQYVVVPRNVAKSLAPPLGWIYGAVCGVLIALVALIFALRHARAVSRQQDDNGKAICEAHAGSAATSAIVVMLLASSPLILAATYGLVF